MDKEEFAAYNSFHIDFKCGSQYIFSIVISIDFV